AEVKAGDWFGEISLLTGYAATATVRATSPIEMAVVDSADLRGVIGLVPSVGEQLLDKVLIRLHARDSAQLRPRERLLTRITGAARRRAASVGFGRPAPDSLRARQLESAFPDLLELPVAAAEALADLGVPDLPETSGSDGIRLVPPNRNSLPEGDAWFLPRHRLAEALGRSPHLLHLLARHLGPERDSPDAEAQI
ncbi:MAG: hypothetical protein KDA24_26935, partial [Deltaproteobacteria bacterium]|nr:hypothetical protein [Deltaproteobacteria bacterium]